MTGFQVSAAPSPTRVAKGLASAEAYTARLVMSSRSPMIDDRSSTTMTRSKVASF